MTFPSPSSLHFPTTQPKTLVSVCLYAPHQNWLRREHKNNKTVDEKGRKTTNQTDIMFMCNIKSVCVCACVSQCLCFDVGVECPKSKSIFFLCCFYCWGFFLTYKGDGFMGKGNAQYNYIIVSCLRAGAIFDTRQLRALRLGALMKFHHFDEFTTWRCVETGACSL